MAPHAGVIIAASVLVAAGIAAYENPEFRAWLERSSQKVALTFKSLGNDLHQRRRSPSRPEDSFKDTSMREDADKKAEERRRRAREEIMEKGRALKDRESGRKHYADSSRTPSFDSIVDEDGRLKSPGSDQISQHVAASSALEQNDKRGIRSRREVPQMHESVDAPILLRQLELTSRPPVAAVEPWESQYEREMRNAWNIDLPPGEAAQAQSRASESLIDVTPTTEDFPDPDYSVPSLAEEYDRARRSEYFSAAASQIPSSHRDEAANVHQGEPLVFRDPRPFSPEDNRSATVSSHASMAGSAQLVGHSEADMTDDDLSEFGDGIRTPASAWTEVASSVSGDE